MIEILKDPALTLLAIPTLLIAINNLLKNVGMNKKWCPLINLFGGFIAYPFILTFGCTWYTALIGSLMIGLGASGLYDIGTKTLK